MSTHHSDSNAEQDNQDANVLSDWEREGPQTKIWTRDEEAILHESIKTYRAKPRNEKSRFVRKEVTPQIKALMIEKYGKDAFKGKGEQQIFTWMANHASTARALKMPGMQQKFNFIRVLTELKKTEILDEMKRLAEEAGEGRYIRFYQRARANIRAQLTDAEIKEYEETMKKWNAGSVPPAVQIRYATKYSKRVLAEMNKRNFVSMGMRSIIMECHMGPNDRMLYSFTDSNSLKLDDVNIVSFNTFDPHAVAAMTRAYKRYCNHVTNVLKKITQPLPAATFNEQSLTYHPGGLPMVPPPLQNKAGNENGRMAEKIIRTYVSKHYDLAVGKSMHTPWTFIMCNPDLFFKPEHFPASVKFKDPSKYAAVESAKILHHWRARQSKGKVPFMFLKVRIGKEVIPAEYDPEIFDRLAPPTEASKDRRKQKLTSTMKHVHTTDDDTDDPSSDDEEEQLVTVEDDPAQDPHQGSVAGNRPTLPVPSAWTPPPSGRNSEVASRHSQMPEEPPVRPVMLFGRSRNELDDTMHGSHTPPPGVHVKLVPPTEGPSARPRPPSEDPPIAGPSAEGTSRIPPSGRVPIPAPTRTMRSMVQERVTRQSTSKKGGTKSSGKARK